jgi:ACS family hexuronate transporter-like MFS transporter
MKVKGLRWWVLALVVLITIINYLDRGTLNYMWNVTTKHKYALVHASLTTKELPYATFNPATNEYTLFDKDGSNKTVKADKIKTLTGTDKPTIQYAEKEGIAYDLGLTDPTKTQIENDNYLKKLYSYINIFFLIAYGISQMLSGKLYDKIGTRKGFVVSAIIWGTADMLTSFAKGVASLSFFRVMLGLGEAGPWPGSAKSNAEWFPAKERAFAQGFFGAGGSLGSAVAPFVISMFYIAFGWKQTFLLVGSLGLLWLIPWLIINKKAPKDHPWITEDEKQHILAGQTQTITTNDKGKSWGELLKDKKSYAVILGRFFLDPIWWMFVVWLPNYLNGRFNLDIKEIAVSAWVPFLGAGIGAIIGGRYSGWLITKKDYTALKARRTAIITGACITLPAMIATIFATTPLSAVILLGILLGGFQFSIVNIQTLPGDFHTGKTVGSLAGLGGMAAVLGTIGTTFLIPYITTGNNWMPFFVMGALLVPLSMLCIFYFSKKQNITA